MAGVIVAANQGGQDIPEGLLISELLHIIKGTICPLSNETIRVMQVRKNKIYNPSTLKK